MYIIYLVPGLELFSEKLYNFLKHKGENVKIISPLIELCKISNNFKKIIRNDLIKIIDNNELIEINSEYLFTDRIILSSIYNENNEKYFREIYLSVEYLKKISIENKIIIYLEPANDLFSYLVSEINNISKIYFKRAKVRGISNYLWISYELSEIPTDDFNINQLKKITSIYNKSSLIEKNGVYWENKIKWKNINFFNTIISMLKAIKYALIMYSSYLRKKKYSLLLYRYSLIGISRNFRRLFVRSYYEYLAKNFNLSTNKKNYIIFPLQVYPEASTLSSKQFYQVRIIEELSRKIDVNTILLVKEHIDDCGYRPLYIYKYISKLPKVFFLSNEINIDEVINDNKMLGLITISSTLAEDVLRAGKKVVLINKNSLYSKCPGVYLYNNINLNTIFSSNNIDVFNIKYNYELIKENYLKNVVMVDFNYNNPNFYNCLYDFSK